MYFGERDIGIGFDHEWPPRSPDLTPCDFFLWGHVKNQVFKTPPPSLEILGQRIKEEYRFIKKQSTSEWEISKSHDTSEKSFVY